MQSWWGSVFINLNWLAFHCQPPNWDQNMEFLPLKEATSILSLFFGVMLDPRRLLLNRIFEVAYNSILNNRITLRYKHIVKRSSVKFKFIFYILRSVYNPTDIQVSKLIEGGPSQEIDHILIITLFILLPARSWSSKPNHSGTCIDAFKIPAPGGSVWSLWTHQRLNAVWCTTLSAKRLSGITKTYQGWDQRQFRDILHRFDAWSVPGPWVSLWGCL